MSLYVFGVFNTETLHHIGEYFINTSFHILFMYESNSTWYLHINVVIIMNTVDATVALHNRHLQGGNSEVLLINAKRSEEKLKAD